MSNESNLREEEVRIKNSNEIRKQMGNQLLDQQKINN